MLSIQARRRAKLLLVSQLAQSSNHPYMVPVHTFADRGLAMAVDTVAEFTAALGALTQPRSLDRSLRRIELEL